MDNILEIRDLSKSYGSKLALKNISLDIPSGKIVGLLGPNGSGKTTLIKTIMGLLSDYSGTVQIANMPPGHLANKYISYLPDVSHIPRWFTVNQAITFFSDFYPDFDKDRAAGMLETMGIPLKDRIKTLSRGMQEKVNLSLVMSRRARLYVLDEPIGAVDPASREFIVDTILQHFPEDSSILLSTHIIADIESVLDRAIFLKEGQIILNAEADTIREEKGVSLDQFFREVFRNVY
ncbi:MAG: ABC transporter ATP-binding protein [Defluviitaleaceae bacterium]|nr:ABC transporter ATP-binding protein [Defluviitaleaceae bacterium]